MVIIAVGLLAGCNSYKSKTAPSAETVMPASIDYQSVREKIFQPKCFQCHSDAGGNDGDINLETYDSVIFHLAEIREQVLVLQKMPTKKGGGPLSPVEQDILRIWIEAGAPRDEKPQPVPEPTPAPAPTPEVTPSPTPIENPVAVLPTWVDIHEKIFVPKCIKCHSAGGKAEDIPLDSKEFVIDPQNQLVTVGQPNQSELYIAITKVGKGQMPPVKSGLTLFPSDIDAIKIWIVNGVKD